MSRCILNVATGKDLDAISFWDPHAYVAEKELGGNAITFSGKDIHRSSLNIAATAQYAKEHPAVVEKLLKALLEAEDFVNKNPDEAMRITSKYTGMKQEYLVDLWSKYEKKLVLDNYLIETMNKEAAWAKEQKLVNSTSSPDYKSLVDATFLKSVAPSRVTIR